MSLCREENQLQYVSNLSVLGILTLHVIIHVLSVLNITSIGYRSYITIIEELSGNERSECTTLFLYNCNV